MLDGCTTVLDIGKTNSKVSVWDENARLVERRIRANERPSGSRWPSLDVAGIDAWLMASLADLPQLERVRRIIPVGHGAAAALVYDGRLFAEPMDYETVASAEERQAYSAERDAFAETGSPFLPGALNLGLQLHVHEARFGRLADDVTILPWPQYWAWRLCGVTASEVSSLGCHSDLWSPAAADFSALASRRAWAARMAPLRRAHEVLGHIRPEVAAATGLSPDCEVLCGLHDSNAALLAARGHAEIADNEATVLSTGTWFVAMRTPGEGTAVDLRRLEETRDCLVNVDVTGRPVPSARFMGGREAELAGGLDSFQLTKDYNPDRLVARIPAVLASGAIAHPGFVNGVGPFPRATGHWHRRPNDPGAIRIATCLYLALMADAMLDLIGSRERLLVEGRFADEVLFVRALASLRPAQRVYVSNAHNDVAFGALRLVDSGLDPSCALMPVTPLDVDLTEYADAWRRQAAAANDDA